MWGQRRRLGKVGVCPALELDACGLVRAKEEWGHKYLRRFYGNSLKEGQAVVAIVCDGVQRLDDGRLGGALLCLTWFCFGFLGFNSDNAIIIVGLVCLICGIRVQHPLRAGERENLEELARVQLALEDCSLHQKCGVAGSPVFLLLGSREVAGGGAKKDFRNW